jgi:hypothetical protein
MFFAWIMLSLIALGIGSLVISITANTWIARVVFAALFLSYVAASVFVLQKRRRKEVEIQSREKGS